MRKVAEVYPKQGLSWDEDEWIELQKRGDEGAEIHALISNAIHNKEVKATPRSESSLAAFRLWRKTSGIDLYFTDVFVYSHQFQYSGFIDAIGMDAAGDVVIVDFKSGKGMYNSYALQLAAYCKALEECCDATVVEGARHDA